MEIASSSTTNTNFNHNRNHTRNICLVVLAVIIVVVMILVTLLLTVFKPKPAVTTINSVNLVDYDVSFDLPRSKVYLNLTINVDLSIKNPNKVAFMYKNSMAILYYRGLVVGEVPILADKINSGETKQKEVRLTLIADRLLSKRELYRDVLLGTVPVSTHTRIAGNVFVLNIIKVHAVSKTSCDVNINALDGSIVYSECKYKTKI